MTDNTTLIKSGGAYNATIAGKRVRVRAISRSEDRPGFWICETLDSSEEHLVIAEECFEISPEDSNAHPA